MAGKIKLPKKFSPPFALCNIVLGYTSRTFHSTRWPCKTRVCTSFPSYFYLYRQLYPSTTNNNPSYYYTTTTTTLCTRLPPFFSSSWPPSSLPPPSSSSETFFASESTTETRLRSLSPLSSYFSIRKIKGIGINATVPLLRHDKLAYCLYSPLFANYLSFRLSFHVCVLFRLLFRRSN